MTEEWVESLMDVLPPGLARAGTRLAELTTWGVGGPAEVLAEPETGVQAEEVIRAAAAHGVACRIVGGGSNLLVSDRGIPGVVLRPSGSFAECRVRGCEVVAGAGSRLPSLARECERRGLSGLEFAIGIPGTLGGAVATNAGAEGSEMGRVVRTVEVVRRSGERETWDSPSLGFAYRHSRLLDEPALVVSATLGLAEDDPVRIERRTEALLEKRRRQPRGASAGSVFRNPEGDAAGRLLESVGVKGLAVGGARVAREHANFILTEKGATADDVARLILELQQRVLQETGILLRPEVIFAGFDERDPVLPRGARLVGPIT